MSKTINIVPIDVEADLNIKTISANTDNDHTVIPDPEGYNSEFELTPLVSSAHFDSIVVNASRQTRLSEWSKQIKEITFIKEWTSLADFGNQQTYFSQDYVEQGYVENVAGDIQENLDFPTISETLFTDFRKNVEEVLTLSDIFFADPGKDQLELSSIIESRVISIGKAEQDISSTNETLSTQFSKVLTESVGVYDNSYVIDNQLLNAPQESGFAFENVSTHIQNYFAGDYILSSYNGSESVISS